jgi:hypothetical protein
MVGNITLGEMEEMSNIWSEKRAAFLSILFVVTMLLLGTVPLPVQASNPTVVAVSPTSRTVSAGQTFTLNVTCTPGQAIKSYEFKVTYNPSYLHANSVTEGNLFSGYTTFFNNGTINNTAGSIINVYDLILGSGSVSNPGTCAKISFTACLQSGTSAVGLTNVGVTNATSYVPVTVTNGSVTLRNYVLNVAINGSGSVSRNPNQTSYAYGTVVQMTATGGSGWAFSSWGGNLSGSTNPASITMNGNKSVTAYFTQNQYTLTITVNGSGSVTKNPNQATYTFGTVVTLTGVANTGWGFNSWGGDLSGSQNPKTITMNGNKLVYATFIDTMAPQISGVTRSTSSPLDTDPSYGWVNVSGTVTDNVGVSQVVLKIHNPGGSWNNVTMTSRTSGKYYYRSTTAFSTAGNYSYYIWAKDTSNNPNSSSTVVFSMPANWDINMDGYCNILDLVLISNYYGQSGSNGWIRQDVDNNGLIQVLDMVNLTSHYGTSWY